MKLWQAALVSLGVLVAIVALGIVAAPLYWAASRAGEWLEAVLAAHINGYQPGVLGVAITVWAMMTLVIWACNQDRIPYHGPCIPPGREPK